MTEPIDVAVLADLTSFAVRRVICNGQLSALTSASWNNANATATATYSTGQSAKLTGVTNIATIPVGARVIGTGVGREVYVTSKDIAASTLTLSQPLTVAGTRSYTFNRYKYMLDFSGFTSLQKFEITDIEFLCNGYASAIVLATSGETFRVADCLINRAKDRGITSTGRGCQDLIIEQNQFVSNEQSVVAQDRTTIAFNVNANDVKIRSNRSARFAHFAVLAGTGHIILGNHFFGGDGATAGIRRAGIVFTTPNAMSFVTGNYVDNYFIEMSNEHDNSPDFASEYSFGALTITGNIFICSDVAPWFRWLVITPRGAGHFVSGLLVTANVFRTVNCTVDRIEKVDTTYATLAYTSFRNVIFEANSFNGITQATASPVLIEHTQNTAAATWTVDSGGYLPFGSRARNVASLVAEGVVTNSADAAVYTNPYVAVEQGSAGDQVQVKWSGAVKGKMQVTLRCDNPI